MTIHRKKGPADGNVPIVGLITTGMELKGIFIYSRNTVVFGIARSVLTTHDLRYTAGSFRACEEDYLHDMNSKVRYITTNHGRIYVDKWDDLRVIADLTRGGY